MSGLTLRDLAAALGGEISVGSVHCPGPNHSRTDRSLSVRLSPQSPGGFVCHSFADDPFDLCRDYVTSKLGLDPNGWKRSKQLPGAGKFETSRRRDKSELHDVVRLETEARIARAVALWNEAGDALGSIVEVYLRSRGLDLNLFYIIQEVIRYHPRCPWRDEAENRTVYVPAMVAAMRSIETDTITAVHRTRLTPEGAKVDRRMLGIAAGAAVKIDGDDAVTGGLHIGEGIETVLAARQLDFLPAWALASAGAIASFEVLPGIECLTILAENDPTNAKAVETCARRWHEAGREVVVVQPKRGSDLNDHMRGAA